MSQGTINSNVIDLKNEAEKTRVKFQIRIVLSSRSDAA